MPIPQLLFRSIISMPIAGAAFFALALLEPGAARAESCSVDPFGAEVCLPTPEPPPPGAPPPPRDAKCPSSIASGVLWALPTPDPHRAALPPVRGNSGA